MCSHAIWKRIGANRVGLLKNKIVPKQSSAYCVFNVSAEKVYAKSLKRVAINLNKPNMKTFKSITSYGFLIAALVFLNISCNAQDKIIPESELPGEVTTYLKMHFPDNPLIQASIDRDTFSHSYDVVLKDNISLEFDSDGNVTEIESRAELPASVIPKEILTYVKSKHPDRVILEWKLDDRNQEVELDNGLELEFDMKGNFTRIDD